MNRILKYTLPLCALTILITGYFSSCKKDEDNEVAQYHVDFTIYLNQPAFVNLNAVGGWIYYNAGTEGMIIYRRSSSDFTALERNCSYDPNASCSIVQVLSGITAIDSCCTSRFSIVDGSVLNGPATQPLYQYRTQYDGQTLRVYN